MALLFNTIDSSLAVYCKSQRPIN